MDSVNADGTKVFGNTDGTYARYCTTAFACLGGTPVNGGSAVVGQKGSVTSAENLNNLTLGGFIAGLDECWPGETGNGMCAGTSQSGEGVKGLSRLTILDSTAAKAENRQWAFGTRNNEARWFNVNGGLEKILYGSANDPAPAVPTGGVNPSAMNNYGSAVIDGLLIQHMKLTTKGL